ncbi:MAG: ATP-binding protein [Crocinitomicaceae bacterium]|jgi:DNA replication protein DnaC|nr:ATP-binding protein [Crocinitomicaceae bacterium]MBK7184287.1 ATP-binding protein [Bacteroidota bacterium]MBK9191294.1 ATP-binding protein [Crocinitomicaceae bacterium]MBK9193382.1 ATP-binding protein [Crocinitomicaceae bacterium]MBK9592389.1 ATP-binding protein [Crocinitomicaceae bacterium]
MNESSLEKLRQMHLYGMLKALRTNIETDKNEKLTPDELVSFLVDSEWDERYNRKLSRTISNAKFRYKASIEQLTFEDNRFNKNQVMRVANCEFIKKKENLIITGSTGIGKSFLASAVGHEACSQGYKVLYQHSTKLFAKLKMAKADGSYLKELAKIEKQDLLIIDDFGIQPLDAQSRASLMEIIEDRHAKASTLLTSQLPVNKWHEAIGEQTIADAILDRIVHDAHRLELKGESMRKKRQLKEDLVNEK